MTESSSEPTAEFNPIVQLASRSPRRRELLNQIGVRYSLVDIDIDESNRGDEDAQSYVERLAIEKSCAGFKVSPILPTLGADTIVVCDGRILGKPRCLSEAKEMLALLSAREHQVITAVAVTLGDITRHRASSTVVGFRELSPAEIDLYCDREEVMDKAGSYGIQGLAAIFVCHLRGSYSGVVGLPLFETADLLSEFDLSVMTPFKLK